ncbi:hypothetical protein BD770DRAFT_404617 [Pilaira anomala]|nr:hypothetical protein BD770DRAFT_404617 [Pilaira anomala]
MESHSLQLGYRWSPPKCQVIKDPTPTIFKIYNEIIHEQKIITYLGLPFNNKGICEQQFLEVTHEKVTKKMQVLSYIGARSNAFSTTLSIKLYKSFIRPKIEYGLSVMKFNKQNITRLERIQADCLRMIVGGHRTASMKSFSVMTNTPWMETRLYTLNTRYLLRLQTLPTNSLVYKLHQNLDRYHRITLLQKKNPIYQQYVTDPQVTNSNNSQNQTIRPNFYYPYDKKGTKTSPDVANELVTW